MMMAKGIFIVVSAPSGTGKSSICRKLLDLCPQIKFSVSYTTRPPRPKEVNGEDYFFISRTEFQKRIKQDEFAEWVENYGNLYGTSAITMKESLNKGDDLLLDIEPRGAKKIKERFRRGIFVFVLPPSREELWKRLKGRGHDKASVIRKRFIQAEDELKEVSWYDYVIFNENLEEAVKQLQAIYVAEKCKRGRLQNKIKEFMKN
jgi:guanylate kinase